MLKSFVLIAICLLAFSTAPNAQKRSTTSESKKPDSPQTTKKTNARPAAPKTATEPFEKATVAKMAEQCVKLETEAGVVEMALLPETAPETVRNFLNLVAIGAYDTTTFSRVVPGFIVQGGNLSTRGKITAELDKRSQRTIPDEPNAVKHERGVVSMARSGEPNSASTHFFILVGDARHLDGTFAAFGRVTSGMEIVDGINKMPVEGDKPAKPVLLKRAAAAVCAS
jgi:peptidyl-prolyl cis-trans isomerase B (cyclophilin B)